MNKKTLISMIVIVVMIGLIGYMAYGYYKKVTYAPKHPIVTMEVEGYGTVKMELYPECAPNTVRNFIKLINEGYYNGLTFHRVEESLIQGGDILGDGTGTTQYTIKGEFAENGFTKNTLSFEKGTIGLARTNSNFYYYYFTGDESYLEMDYNSGCAQFFIMVEDEKNFDGYYCAFGKVIEGLDIVEEISKIETKTEINEETGEEEHTTTPVNPPVITKMTVDTFGVTYYKPEIIEK